MSKQKSLDKAAAAYVSGDDLDVIAADFVHSVYGDLVTAMLAPAHPGEYE